MHKLSLLIISLLLLATLIIKVQILVANDASSDEANTNFKRIKTWWIICLLGISIFYVGGWTITLLTMCLAFWALLEIARLLNVNLNTNHYLLIVFTLCIYTFLAKQLHEFQLILFAFPFALLVLSLFVKNRHRLQWFALLFFCISALNSIDGIAQLRIDKVDSRFLVLFLCFITGVNDIAQYIFGRIYGQKFFHNKKLAPTISPKKTIEGALGGILVTGLITCITLASLLSLSYFFAFMLGVVLSALGIIGDLYFSYYKRQAKVKNSGNTLPGHGGLLDRIDSLLLTAPGFGLCLTLIT